MVAVAMVLSDIVVVARRMSPIGTDRRVGCVPGGLVIRYRVASKTTLANDRRSVWIVRLRSFRLLRVL